MAGGVSDVLGPHLSSGWEGPYRGRRVQDRHLYPEGEPTALVRSRDEKVDVDSSIPLSGSVET